MGDVYVWQHMLLTAMQPGGHALTTLVRVVVAQLSGIAVSRSFRCVKSQLEYTDWEDRSRRSGSDAKEQVLSEIWSRDDSSVCPPQTPSPPSWRPTCASSATRSRPWAPRLR